MGGSSAGSVSGYGQRRSVRGRVRRAPPRDPPEDPKNPFKIPPESIPGGPQIAGPEAGDAVVALWEAFYIEDKRFGFDTHRVPSRSPTPISTSNDFLPVRRYLGGPGPSFPAEFGQETNKIPP
jgi:hypothetical protein